MHELRQRNCLINAPTEAKQAETAWFAHCALNPLPRTLDAIAT
jgi:hypothetical protein